MVVSSFVLARFYCNACGDMWEVRVEENVNLEIFVCQSCKTTELVICTGTLKETERAE
jgi:hypothetical protein